MTRRRSQRLTVVSTEGKISRAPHEPRVSPFAPNKDALPKDSAGRSLALRVLGFQMAIAPLPRRGS